MKQLKIPFIPELESSDFKTLELKMETGAAKAAIDTVCWPGEFPYAPAANVSIARSATHIIVHYSVSGLDLRAMAMENNGPVWEDSCCEGGRQSFYRCPACPDHQALFARKTRIRHFRRDGPVEDCPVHSPEFHRHRREFPAAFGEGQFLQVRRQVRPPALPELESGRSGAAGLPQAGILRGAALLIR